MRSSRSCAGRMPTCVRQPASSAAARARQGGQSRCAASSCRRSQPRGASSRCANTASSASSSQANTGLFRVCASFRSAWGRSSVSTSAIRSCASSACSRPPRREVMKGMPAASSARSYRGRWVRFRTSAITSPGCAARGPSRSATPQRPSTSSASVRANARASSCTARSSASVRGVVSGSRIRFRT